MPRFGWLIVALLTACGGGGGSGGGNNPPPVGDTQAPSVPAGLTVQATAADTVRLDWSASSDDTAVAGYRVYRDGAMVKSVVNNATTDAGLVNGVSYCYEVSAYDAADNESARSAMQCATPGNVWTQRLPAANVRIEAIIHDGTRYLAVGDPASTHYALTSNDGITWASHEVNGPLLDLADVVWTGSRYIGTTRHGTFATSPDAVDWTVQHFLTGLIDINGLAWSGSLAVAVGEDGRLLTTPDGVTWTDLTGVTTEYLRDVHWLNGRFVVVGSNGTVLFSTDGANWSVESTGVTDSLAAVAWDGTQYVALANNRAYLSVDGSVWAPIDVTGLFEDLVWSDTLGLFVAVDANGRIVTSPDGVTWTEQTDFNQFEGLDTIFWDGAMLIAGGDIGEIATSDDGVNWVTRVSAIDLERVRWDGTRLLAVGGPSKVFSSPDGISWAFHRTGYSGTFMRDIATSPTRVVAAAQTYYMSTDGNLTAPWPERQFFGATTVDTGILWDGSRFVSVGSDGRIRYSTDGINRSDVGSAITGTSELLRDLVFTGTQYVMVGNAGTILTTTDPTSTDPVDWDLRSSGTADNLYAVTDSGSLLIAVGQNGAVVTSTDGVSWAVQTSGTTRTLLDVAWASDEFIAVGFGTTVIRSADGIAWSPIDQGVPFNSYYSVAYTGERVVLAGDNGAIVTLEKP